MSNDKTNSGPAFPTTERVEFHEDLGSGKPGCREYMASSGMDLRQYAAIKLRVPDSGLDWLDEMIRKSLRDELAGKAMQIPYLISEQGLEGCAASVGMSPEEYKDNGFQGHRKLRSKRAYDMADELLKAREQ